MEDAKVSSLLIVLELINIQVYNTGYLVILREFVTMLVDPTKNQKNRYANYCNGVSSLTNCKVIVTSYVL